MTSTVNVKCHLQRQAETFFSHQGKFDNGNNYIGLNYIASIHF